MGFLKDGKKVERAFTELYCKKYLGVAAVYSTKEQDINEHWDVKFTVDHWVGKREGEKFDVKGLKRVNRADAYKNELYHFIEIKNVRGNKGWAYGEADYFAFETNLYFIIVEKGALHEFIKKNITKTYVDSPDKSLYALYSRAERDDIITMVTTIDLAIISHEILYKEASSIEIGESVISEVREKERLIKILNKI